MTVEYNDANECPGHGYVTEDGGGDLAFCDGSCVEEELHARLMAGLLGVDLKDRYPRADEDGIIGTAGGPGFLGWSEPE